MNKEPHYTQLVYQARQTIAIGRQQGLSMRVIARMLNRAASTISRKLVLESGPQHLGRWLDYERDIKADFEMAFGEAPGALVGIGIMTDTDNTRGQALAWYGPVALLTKQHPPASSSALVATTPGVGDAGSKQ